MQSSPITVTYSPEEILTRLDGKIDKLEGKIDNLQKDVNELKVGQARLEEKVDGLSKRLEFQEFINRGIFIGLVVAIVGGAARLLGLVGNNP